MISSIFLGLINTDVKGFPYTEFYPPFNSCEHYSSNDSSGIDGYDYGVGKNSSGANSDSGGIGGFAYAFVAGDAWAEANAEAWQNFNFYTIESKNVHVTAEILLIHTEQEMFSFSAETEGETKIGYSVNNGEKIWDQVIDPSYDWDDIYFGIKQIINLFGYFPGFIGSLIQIISIIAEYYPLYYNLNDCDLTESYSISFDMETLSDGMNTISIGVNTYVMADSEPYLEGAAGEINSTFLGQVTKIKVDGIDLSEINLEPNSFDFGKVEDNEILNGEFEIKNIGPIGSYLEWELASWPDFISSIFPTEGDPIPGGESETISFSIDTATLEYGFHDGNIVIHFYKYETILYNGIPIEFAYITYPPTDPLIYGPQNVKIGRNNKYYATSYDPDLDPIYYIWDFGDGTGYLNSNIYYHENYTCEFDHIFIKKGLYTIAVKAIGGYQVGSSWSYLPVTAPHPYLSSNGPFYAIVGEVIPLQGMIDGGTAPYTWTWDFGDESELVYNQNVTHSYNEAGIYQILMTVVDANGSRDSIFTTATIGGVELSASPKPVLKNEQVIFTATLINVDCSNEPFYVFNIRSEEFSSYTSIKEFSYEEAGLFTESIIVYDGEGGDMIGYDTVTVEVDAFRVDIGGSYKGLAGQPIHLVGGASGIRLGMNVEWEFGDGTTDSESGLEVYHTYDEPGNYIINLTVTGLSQGTETVSTTANIYPADYVLPEAVAGGPYCGNPGDTITLEGTGIPGESNITEYKWKFSGSSAWIIGQTVEREFYTSDDNLPTSFQATLKVKDEEGFESTDTSWIKISKINANFHWLNSYPTDISPVLFNDDSAPEPCDEISSWYWEFGDGEYSNDKNPTHQYNDDGYYHVKLRVGSDGKYDTITKRIHVRNVYPITEFDVNPLVNTIGENVIFNSTSYDYDGEIIQWKWDLGDGNRSFYENIVHNYSKSGFYTINLSSVDDDLDYTKETKKNRLLIADAIVSNEFDENTTGWGVTRFDNIQDGIDAVPEDGILVVLNGEYNNDSGFVINKTIDMYAIFKGYNEGDTEIQYGEVDIIGSGDLSNATMLTINASDVLIKGFTIKSGKKGITISDNNTTIEECTISYNNMNGIELLDNSNTTIQNSTITYNNDFGIILNNSDNNSICNSNITQCDIGLLIVNSSVDNSITECGISQNGIGIDNNQSDDNYFYDCEISQNEIGIELGQSDDNLISDCEIKSNDDYGIYLYDSVENKIHTSDICSNDIGILIERCVLVTCSNIIWRCNISDNSYGIYLNYSSYTWIGKGNAESQVLTEFYCNDVAIYLNESDKNTIQDCDINATTCCQSIPCIPTKGIYLDNSQSNKIKNTIVEGADKNGINIANSSYNTVDDCHLTGNYFGVRIDNASSNTVKNCSIDNNINYSIYINGTPEITSSNRIYYNDIIDNLGGPEQDISQAYDAGLKNCWDDSGKPPNGMGNYWSNYDGEDSNEDGIGDTPYTIDGPTESVDNYPVMDPFEWFD